MTINQIKAEIRQSLSPVVGESEASAMANIILEEVKGYSPTQLIIHGERELLPETIERIHRITRRIIDGEPMQYVLGRARFRGRDFDVNPSVLIPRPETGEMVDMIVRDFSGKKDIKVLDIGTGSGCIAISLAIDLPFAQVDAIDISKEALDTAEANAKAMNAFVTFYNIDAMTLCRSALSRKTYDIIVSNPPYVLDSERIDMDARVVNHEPPQALYVPDAQPINIYIEIAEYGRHNLNEGGKLYFEINPLCADVIQRMLRQKGYDDVEIIRDYLGNKRFATAIQPR